MTGIEKAIGETFKKRSFLDWALNHPSCPEAEASQGLRFQRLEFLGDAIINSFIAFRLYQMFPDANEGTMSRFRAVLVSRKTLAQIASKLKLKKYLRLGEREHAQLRIVPENILSDSYEALVAALYLDRGRKSVERFLEKCFKPYLNFKTMSRLHSHPKSTLQEHCQKTWGVLPIYETQFDSAKEMFKTSVRAKTKKAKGIGRTKQESESDAATSLIRKLKLNSGKKKIYPSTKNVPAS